MNPFTARIQAYHDNAWERDRDNCIRRGGIPVHMHMPDGSMTACAQPIRSGG